MSIYSNIQNLLDQIEGPQAEYKKEVLKDLWICLVSREVSLVGRKEVLTGKAKFGILGDGKELPQVAMARAFKKGDFRSGYYRDQTFMFALGLCSVKEYFGQLYADPQNDPFSGGRQMNAHFATPLIDSEGNWTDHTKTYNVSSDVSSTGGQMARALGLALASKQYRQNKDLKTYRKNFSNKGNEVSFVTIGDASTSEGVFWETMNAASVMQVPLAVCVWDDGYGISVPIALQTVKQNISEALSGFEKSKDGNGLRIFSAKGWDYPSLVNLFHEGVEEVRSEHVPALFHIQEVTQPQGHSTSGSHERYKSKKRLEWEEKYDCLRMFSKWIADKGIASSELCEQLKELAKIHVRDQKNEAWSDFVSTGQFRKKELLEILESISGKPSIDQAINSINSSKDISWHELVQIARQCLGQARKGGISSQMSLLEKWISNQYLQAQIDYHAHLYSETNFSALKVPEILPEYSNSSKELNGYQIINQYFDQLLAKHPEVLAFGEDVGMIGDVNQGFAGLQEKYGDLRVFDTGIREWTIIGQAIGMSMRGLRPISEIQYLDYIVYALSPLMDDLATLRYRSDGIQRAPTIIRTRGHRLEGIWHSGSPIGMLLNSLRGIHICVPRNMTQAAGMYQTLLQSDDPGLVIECLNGYRLKEKMPDNLGSYTIPLGKIEVLRGGNDITLVTYGSCIRIAEKAIEVLSEYGIDVELIDIQTLLPFDLDKGIRKSLAKTNKLVILDEDVPGGASAFILQQVLEEQNAFSLLDSKPTCITASSHRPPYGSDGDYFSKPNPEDVVEVIYKLMHEYDPGQFN
ncbi:MAG: transketolase [Saprospiraceae bacterium]|nr:transketolase [Candidatus Vicinibacter affinis]